MTKSIFRITELIVITVSLVFISIQTYFIRQDLEFQKVDKLGAHPNELNRFLIQNSDLTMKTLGLTQENILAFIMINDAQQIYLFYHGGFITKKQFEAAEPLMKLTFQKDFIKLLWEQEQSRYGFDPDFVDYIDTILEENP